MPNFGSQSPLTALYQGDSKVVWQAESPGAGATSQEVALAVIPGNSGVSLSVEIVFHADPGAFEVDLMTSDTDTLADFTSIKTITTDTTGFVARAEVSPVVANFACLFIKTLTNNVQIDSAKITLH